MQVSRKKNEYVQIAENIRVTVIEVRGDKVRLGIEAPREISVYRGEIFESIQREQQEGRPELPQDGDTDVA